LNINLLNIKNNSKHSISNNSNNNLPKKIYHNYFSDNKKNEQESRRMLIEYVKVLNQYNNINKNNVKQILSDNNISKKILNQKFKDLDNDNYSKELFGEAKKQLYLNNLNYSLSYDSSESNNGEDTSNNNLNSNFLNLSDLNDLLVNKDKKKINIINYLCMPRVLNLIEEDNNKDKYIFLITLDEKYFIEAKQSYHFQWRNMENNEIENDFNLKDIKSCILTKNYNNRFIIEIEKKDLFENLKFEIEAPSNEICNNYVMGINYLIGLTKNKKK
jgi:hypothetical protein